MKNKSILLTSILFLSLGIFSSCSKKDKTRIKEIDNIDSFIYLTSEEFNDLINHDESFVIVVGENGCSTCDIIKPVIQEYIKKYHRVIYWIENSSYQVSVERFVNDINHSLKSAIQSSTVLIFKNGTYSSQIDYDANIYYTKDKFDVTLSNKVSSSNYIIANDINKFSYSNDISMYKMNYDTTSFIDSIISKNQNTNVLFSWKECGDCKEMKETFLNDFLIKKNIKLYEYEVNSTRSLKYDDGSVNLTLFNQFADKYQFSSYRGGKVPTIVTYSNSKKKDMVVFSNDEIKEENGLFIVSNSYYSSLISLSNKSKLDLHNELISKETKIIKEYLTKKD